MSTLKKPHGARSSVKSQIQPREAQEWSLDGRWGDLVLAVADEMAHAVATLQNQMDQLLSRERLSPIEHRALSVPVERLKQTSLTAQRIQRFHAGRIRQSHEKVPMADLVEALLDERRRDFAALAIELRRKCKPVEVLIDPTVAYAFVNAALDWAMPFGQRVDVRLDLNTWPQHARLQVRAFNEGMPPSSAAQPDNLSWMLLREIAKASGGIEIEREVNEEGVSLTVFFTRTVQSVDGLSTLDMGDDPTTIFKSMQGVYVLTVSPSLPLRAEVRDALRELGITSDSVVDFLQARAALLHRTPNLIILDAELRGDDFDDFQRSVLRDFLEMPFVEISHDSRSFDMSGFDELSMAKVGRTNIRESLGTAVMFELAKVM